MKNRWASLTKKNPRLADGSPGSAPSASGDSSFSGSMPSQSRSGQSNQGSLQPTRMPGASASSNTDGLRHAHLKVPCCLQATRQALNWLSSCLSSFHLSTAWHQKNSKLLQKHRWVADLQCKTVVPATAVHTTVQHLTTEF